MIQNGEVICIKSDCCQVSYGLFVALGDIDIDAEREDFDGDHYEFVQHLLDTRLIKVLQVGEVWI